LGQSRGRGCLNLSEQQVANISLPQPIKRSGELVMASGLSPSLFPELNRE
jgi:hypothetical protein